MSEYKAPESIWDVEKNLKFDIPLDSDDPRFVDTLTARGQLRYSKILKAIGLNNHYQMKFESEESYNLFCGHRGCGKSTELRNLSKKLHNKDSFFVIFLDALTTLDVNDLKYVDILMALSTELFKALEENNISIKKIHLSNLENWFYQKIKTNDNSNSFSGELTTGIEAKTGIPGLFSIFAKLTTSIKTNATYKEELRKIIKNSFSEFADSFNSFIIAVEDELKKQHMGKKILFIVDGTDRLCEEDSKNLFISNVHQLQSIKSNFIYCAPIHLIHKSNQVNQVFKTFNLPMVKIYEKDGTKNEEAFEVMKKILHSRASKKLFCDGVEDYLIEYSGGNPRELLRLLNYTYQFEDNEYYTMECARQAVKELATDFRRILDTEDYKILIKIDKMDEIQPNNDHVNKLLFDLAIMEYNSFWRKSHPVIRTLSEYKSHDASLR